MQNSFSGEIKIFLQHFKITKSNKSETFVEGIACQNKKKKKCSKNSNYDSVIGESIVGGAGFVFTMSRQLTKESSRSDSREGARDCSSDRQGRSKTGRGSTVSSRFLPRGFLPTGYSLL